MGKKPSDWNLYVKKVFEEGKKTNSNFKFKDAMVKAKDTWEDYKKKNGISVSGNNKEPSLKKREMKKPKKNNKSKT